MSSIGDVMIDYYEILGIPSHASTSEVEAAFNRLLVENPSLKNLAKAHSTLKDETTRKNYDKVMILDRLSWDKTDLIIASDRRVDPDPLQGARLKKQRDELVRNYAEGILAEREAEPSDAFKSDYFLALTQQMTLGFDGFVPSEHMTSQRLIEEFLLCLQGQYSITACSQFRAYVLETLSRLDGASVQERKLHQAISHILSNILGDEDHVLLTAAVDAIVEYSIQVVLHSTDTQEKQKATALIQHESFKALFVQSVEARCARAAKEGVLSDIDLFFESQQDVIYDQGQDSNPKFELYRYYVIQKRLKQNYEVAITPDALRALAFECVDYMSCINDSASIIIVSGLLQAAFFLKKASALEMNQADIRADDVLITKLLLKMTNISKFDGPFLDLYTHLHGVRLLANMSPTPLIKEALEGLKARTLSLASTFPIVTGVRSALDLVFMGFKNMIFIDNYLQAMFQNPLLYVLDEDTQLTQMIYQAYVSSYRDHVLATGELAKQRSALRTVLMTRLLHEKGWSYGDIMKNMDTSCNITSRDAEGWITPGCLAYPDALETWQSIDGFDVNQKTGEVKFHFTPWTQDDPLHKRVMSSLEFNEAIQLELSHAAYTLNSPKGVMMMNPFHEEAYEPPSLANTFYLSALRQADLLLKYIVLGFQGQSQPPYNASSFALLIEKMPPGLKKIIDTYHDHAKDQEIHRFWLEPVVVSIRRDENRSVLDTGEEQWDAVYTLAKQSVLIKVQQRIHGHDGVLVDKPESEEGWPIYVYDDVEEMKHHPVDRPSIAHLKGSQRVDFYGDVVSSHEIHLTQEEWLRLYEQERDESKQVKSSSDDRDKTKVDNYHDMYLLIKKITQQAGKPHRFSNVREFVGELTEHYDELAAYFPEFERLRQLTLLSGVVLNLVSLREENRQALAQVKLDGLETTLVMLKNFYEQMQGHLAACNEHPELPSAIQAETEALKNDYIAHTNAASWEREKAKLIKDYITDKFIPLKVSEYKISVAQGHREQLIKIFKDVLRVLDEGAYLQAIDAYRAGNFDPLARAFQKAKLEYHQCFEQAFSFLGAKKDEPRVASDKVCSWVPIVPGGERGDMRVWGGVVIQPMVVNQLHPFYNGPSEALTPQRAPRSFKQVMHDNKVANRLLGLAQCAGGITQSFLSVGVGVLTLETGFGPVLATMSATMGVDNAVAGWSTLMTGEPKQTLANQVLRATGLSESSAMLAEVALNLTRPAVLNAASSVVNTVDHGVRQAVSKGIKLQQGLVTHTKVYNTSIFHAARRSDVTQSILDGIDPRHFNDSSRFGRAFYGAFKPETSILEVIYRNLMVSQVIRFSFLTKHAKILDLSQKSIAKTWGYVEDSYDIAQSIALRAKSEGYNVILFKSVQGEGLCAALLDDFKKLLSPQMVTPVEREVQSLMSLTK